MGIIRKIWSKLSREYRYLQRDLAARLGMHETFFRKTGGNRILIYHGVCQKDPAKFNTLFVTARMFEKHLQLYKKYFHIISLDDFFEKKFDDTKFNICLTFDDGFANNYKYVRPLLEKYQVPATFFVTAIRKEGYNILWNDFLTISSVTGPRAFAFNGESFYKNHQNTYISSHTKKTLSDRLREMNFDKKKQMMKSLGGAEGFVNPFETEDYWLQMTGEQIREAARSAFITIGSHGYYHNDLGKIPVGETAWELRESKLFLQELTGKQVTQMAFPYGSYTPEAVSEALRAGYEKILATEFQSVEDNDNDAMRERMGINPFITAHNQVYAIIKGRYE